MIKILKSNKFITLLLFIICIFFIIKPDICSKSCLNGVSVWGLKVFPMLFPFFIITRLILNLNNLKPSFMDKFFNKAYNAPNGSFFIFILSVLCGYPMGAKLISTMHDNHKINSNQAKKMLSFCSISGPMFMIGTVGVAVFNNYVSGVIILITNIIASLLNGLIHRGKEEENTQNIVYESKNNSNLLSECVYDSLISILMVGSYIILSFIIIDVLKELDLFYIISNTISNLFNCQTFTPVFESIFSGILEITKGIIDLNACNVNITIKTIISSSLIGFGGFSIILQSIGFLKNTNIKLKTILFQKFTQSLLCLFISIPFSVIFL